MDFRGVISRIAGVIVLIFALALPAHAHTAAEQVAWERGWVVRVKDNGGLSIELLHEWIDFQKRHLPRVESTASNDSSTHRGMGSDVEQWRDLVAAHFPASQVDLALCVMSGESGGNPNADNPRSSAAGLFQFLQSTWDGMVPSSVTEGSYASGQVYLPEANVRAAAWLAANVGWSQWNAYWGCD